MQPFEVAYMAVIVLGVMCVAALATDSKAWALAFFVLALIAWNAYMNLMPA